LHDHEEWWGVTGDIYGAVRLGRVP
jgi:hypothetical protein